MAVQNNYNNYIKRQQQSSTNQFRQKIANSLTGKTVGNNTTKTKVSPSTMGQVKVNALGVNNAPKPKTTPQLKTTPQPQPTVQANTVQPKASTIGEGMFTGDMPVNASQSTTTPQNTTSGATTPIQPVATETPVENQTGTTGMMSLSDINKAIQGENTSQLTQEDVIQINELSNNPEVKMKAYANGKTPQQMAQELLEMQKEQLKKDWEIKKQELELQKNQAQQSHEQSVKDAENAYLESVDKLNDARYQQKEELSVSGQRRGIQYSPQQLGLENVANINHNKNLAEASKSRNELLNNLSIELGKVMGNITMGLQSATNDYNSNVTNLMANYQKQMMDWAYNDQQTESDRKWQEEQALKDQQFQKEMAELQNKWQAEQNALDRKQYGKSRSGGGGGYSYSGYSYSPYSRSYSGNDYGGYGFSSDLDLSSKEGETAFISTVKQDSTDLYNAFDYGTMNEVNEKGEIYAEEMNKYIDYAKSNGASRQVINELEKTKKTALVHLYNKAYARSTGTDIKVGDTIYKGKDVGLPTSSSYKKKLKENRFKDLGKYVEKTSLSASDKSKNRFLVNTMKHANTTSKKKVTNKNNLAQKPNNPLSNQKSKNPLAVKNHLAPKPLSTKTNTKSKAKKTTAKKTTAKKTITKKTTSKVVKMNQNKLQKSFNNLKKNVSKTVSKIFGKKKKKKK